MNVQDFKPYSTMEEAAENAQNIAKEWKVFAYENYTFSAMHKESGLHLFIDPQDMCVKSSNWVDWAKHMCVEKKMPPYVLDLYHQKLRQEFAVWVDMRSESLKNYATQVEMATEAMDAFSPYIASYLAKKQKS